MVNNLLKHRIAALKFDYEFLGKNSQELQVTYGFDRDQIDATIVHEGWERKLDRQSLPDTRDIEEFAIALEKTTRNKLSIISLFRQIENQPLIAQIESVLLEKTLELASNLDANDDRATSKLMNIVKAVASIQERSPIDLADQMKEMAVAGSRWRSYWLMMGLFMIVLALGYRSPVVMPL